MSDPILGVIFALIASTSWAVGAVFARAGMRQVGSLLGTLISLMAGFTVISAIALIIDFDAVFSLSSTTLLWLVLLGFIQFPVGRFLLYSGIRLAGVGPASTAGGSAPLFAAVIAIVFLGEQMTYPIAVGTVSVVGGLALVMSSAHAQSLSTTPSGPSSDAAETPQPHRSGGSLTTGILCALAGATAYGTAHNIARYMVTEAVSAPVAASYTLFSGMVILAAISPVGKTGGNTPGGGAHNGDLGCHVLPGHSFHVHRSLQGTRHTGLAAGGSQSPDCHGPGALLSATPGTHHDRHDNRSPYGCHRRDLRHCGPTRLVVRYPADAMQKITVVPSTMKDEEVLDR